MAGFEERLDSLKQQLAKEREKSARRNNRDLAEVRKSVRWNIWSGNQSGGTFGQEISQVEHSALRSSYHDLAEVRKPPMWKNQGMIKVKKSVGQNIQLCSNVMNSAGWNTPYLAVLRNSAKQAIVTPSNKDNYDLIGIRKSELASQANRDLVRYNATRVNHQDLSHIRVNIRECTSESRQDLIENKESIDNGILLLSGCSMNSLKALM